MHEFIETQKEWMKDIAPFRAGDTLRVNVRVREGDKERLHAFEGVCIARRGAGVSETFTVRKISNGVGVERIFPVHSPMLADIVVVRRGRNSTLLTGSCEIKDSAETASALAVLNATNRWVEGVK